VKAEYDKQIGTFQPQEELRARHILVATKEDADRIVGELDAGGSFEELAGKNSTDGTAQNGGDLGYFSRGQMVDAFEEAAFALEPGTYTKEPVQTQFGFHIIKLEDKRMSAPPPLEEVDEQVRSVLLRQKFETTMAGLREKYTVEILDPSLAPPPAPAPADGAAPPAGETPAAPDGAAPPAQ
jgi:peptidyl-prolyl cis-trans isomerase C